MKRPIALLFCLLMITLPLSGCFGGDEDSSGSSSEKLQDWSVHYASSLSDLPECSSDTNGRLYFIESINEFRVCKFNTAESTSGWDVIDIRGEDGINGISVLVRIISITSCPNGGSAYEIGHDLNFNDVLDSEEVEAVVESCNGNAGAQGPPGSNGQDGALGPQGPAGADGQDGAVGPQGLPGADGLDGAQGTQGPAGADGQDGAVGPQGPPGADGQDGQDGVAGPQGPAGADGQDGAVGPQGPAGNDGQDGQDGVAGPQGPPGNNGQDGSNGLSALISTSNEQPGVNCAYGGIRIDAGIDDNSDFILQSSEIDTTTYVCDGGSTSSTTLTSVSSTPTSWGCNLGGISVSYGMDNGDGGGITANGILEVGEVDYTSSTCKKMTYELLQINNGVMGSSPSNYKIFNDVMYFIADDGVHGYELWMYDGEKSPQMVKDINPGSQGGVGKILDIYNNELYLIAGGSTTTSGLYKFNESGLTLMWGGSCNAGCESVVYDGKLYFNGYDAIFGYTLHSLDENGQISQYSAFEPSEMIVFKGELYFEGKTSPTPTLTPQLMKYNTTGSISVIGSGLVERPTEFTIFNNELYFQARDVNNIYGEELWKYDGLGLSQPTLIADIGQGSVINCGGCGSYPTGLTVYDGKLYFAAQDYVNGKELWYYDGSNSPVMIDINQNPSSTTPNSSPTGMIVYNNELFFNAYNGINMVFYSLSQQNGLIEILPFNSGNGLTLGNSLVYGDNLMLEYTSGIYGWELAYYNQFTTLSVS